MMMMRHADVPCGRSWKFCNQGYSFTTLKRLLSLPPGPTVGRVRLAFRFLHDVGSETVEEASKHKNASVMK